MEKKFPSRAQGKLSVGRARDEKSQATTSPYRKDDKKRVRKSNFHSAAQRKCLGAVVPDDEVTEDSVSTSSMKALLDPMAIYTFKITSQGTRSSSVGGDITTNMFFNPSGVGEYTQISALFDLVRIVHARLSIICINPHSDGYATGTTKSALYIACDGGLSGTNPANVQAVIDCPNVKMINLGSPKTHVIDYKPPPDISWAATASPAPGPYAGCYGQFSCGATGLTVSTSYFTWLLECVYEFTSRT